MVAKLNMKKTVNEGFENLTFVEMRNLDLKNKHILNKALIDTAKIRRSRDSANKAIIDTAILNRGDIIPNDKNLRENREIAKQNYRYDNSIVTRLNIEEKLPVKEERIESSINSTELIGNRNYDDMSDEEKKEYERQLDDLVNGL